MRNFCQDYVDKLTTIISSRKWEDVEQLAEAMYECWRTRKHMYLCGNGGSAGNAIHLANDFLYGIGKNNVLGMRVEALSANPSILTCLGNDIGYEEIFSQQLRVKAESHDILIVLSGSGNSENIIRALDVGKTIGMKTFAIVGYTGGRCLALADIPIHFTINDMQISEDLQLIVGHMCMKWLHGRSKDISLP